MKKRILSIALIASLALSAAGCGKTGSSESEDNISTTVADNSDVSKTTTNVADNNTADEDNATETTTVNAAEMESATIETEDYSEAKAKIEAFYESKSDYKGGIITDNKEDCWFNYDSYIDGENGGDYDSDYWAIYVSNEDTKAISSFNNLNPTSETSPKYEWSQRVGYGNFKIYAVYDNDELGIYFYAEDEVNLNESNVVQGESFLEYHYNLTELIGEEITTKTYQSEKAQEEAVKKLIECMRTGTEPDTSILTKLTNIKRLDISNCRISDVSYLENLTNLEQLNLSGNEISDTSALAKLTNIKHLDMSRCGISDISILESLTNLEYLFLNDNEISDITALAELTNIKHLEISDSHANGKISDISVLGNLTNLEVLFLNYNKISDISALSKLTNLTMLQLRTNKFSDISALLNLPNLTSLELRGNEISDEDITALKEALPDCFISYGD